MIAITFALRTESSQLVRSIDRDQVAIMHTGVGPKIAAQRIGRFLDDKRPHFVISSGFAGALHDELGVGDLILAENFSDQRLLGRASDLLSGHSARTAKLFSAGAIADSAIERDKLRKTHGADAIDMETEVIASACSARGIAMLGLRVITDTPREPLPAPPDILFNVDQQRTSIVRLLGYCAAHPKTIPRLMRFSQNINMARAELTSALFTVLREQHWLFEKSAT